MTLVRDSTDLFGKPCQQKQKKKRRENKYVWRNVTVSSVSTVIFHFQSQRLKEKMQKKTKQTKKQKKSTRVCHTLRQTFSKLSFPHDMKAITALACFPYNLDKSIQPDWLWRGRADIASLCDHRRIIPVLRSSLSLSQNNWTLKVWPATFECTQSTIRRGTSIIIFGLHVNSCMNVPFLIWTGKYACICVHVKPDKLEKSSWISPTDNYFPPLKLSFMVCCQEAQYELLLNKYQRFNSEPNVCQRLARMLGS